MPFHEVLVLQTDTTQLCDRNPRRTVLVITNMGTNGATRINIMDEARQGWTFIMTAQYETLILKASDGFDVTHEWYAYATGVNEYVSVLEEFLPSDIANKLAEKGITSTSGLAAALLLLLFGAS